MEASEVLNRFVTLATLAAVGLGLVMPSATTAAGQKKKKTAPKSKPAPYRGPETSLVGVKIYDSALRVIALYGNPDSVKSVSAGTTTAGPGGGGEGGPPGAGGGRGGRPGGGGAGGAGAPSLDNMGPIDPGFGDLIPGGPFDGPSINFQGGSEGSEMGGGGGQPGGGPPGGRQPGGPPGGPGGPGGGGTGGGSESSKFTRWTYTRNGTKLGFVVDRFNRVIQIEAIGLQNQRVKTRRGIGFGSTFGSVMKAYAPTYDADGYDIGANSFTIRFLTRGRVAFRLSKLANKAAHVVTGIVVSAGKE